MYKKIAVASNANIQMARNFPIILLLVVGILLMLLGQAFATDSTTFAGVAEVLCDVVMLLIMDVGRGIATLSIIALGVAAMYGKATWTQAVTLAMGIGIIFGSLTIAPMLVFSIASLNTSAFGCVAVLAGQVGGFLR